LWFEASQANTLQDPISKITRAKWMQGVTQVPALQVQSPEFKSQSIPSSKKQAELGNVRAMWFMTLVSAC
jgi:hypothetical protein